MPACSSCTGTGSVLHQESDDVMIADACYHCAGSGEVESKVDLNDRLKRVAYTLAYQAETEYRKDRNNDPEGDGYDLGAYENMITVEVYFQDRVLARQFKYMDQLNRLDLVIQKALLEWHEKPMPAVQPTEPTPSPNAASAHSVASIAKARMFEMHSILGDDDLPF